MNAVEQVQQAIKTAIAQAVDKAGLVEAGTELTIHLETPKDKANGDYATNIAMQLTKLAKKPPRAIAEAILENLETAGTDIEKIDIAGPGFMNITVRKDFLTEVFDKMNLEVEIITKFDEIEGVIDIELKGPEMGVLIGKRGQTLDSLQYLTNLAVNRKSDNYLRVKIDTEDYRRRRKETLENLAKNMAYKVKRTKRPVSLEAMNPYERRIIHSALQNDKYVVTHSEGEEPYRHVVITLKK